MPIRRSRFSHLECARCARRVPHGPAPAGLCACGAPLLARYDVAKGAPSPGVPPGSPATLWRYAAMLPDVTPVSLGEGWTPLLPAPRLGAAIGLPRLFVKDEAVNPTGSFKARGMSVAVAAVAALGVRRVAAPSAGNAGSALAAYGARAGLEVLLYLPESTPRIFFDEARAFGAEVRPVPGSIDDAGRALRAAIAAGGAEADGGWVDLSTLREPWRVEGKKTMAYEIAEQAGWELPDVVVHPAGGGTGIIGLWKAFDEMEALGWIGPARPRMIAAQASGCAPLVRAFEAGHGNAEPWADPRTVASGLRVPATLGDFLVLAALRHSGGAAVAVDDREMMDAAARAAGLEGIDVGPEGGAAIAVAARLRLSGALRGEERVVVFNTGTGLKYPRAAPAVGGRRPVASPAARPVAS